MIIVLDFIIGLHLGLPLPLVSVYEKFAHFIATKVVKRGCKKSNFSGWSCSTRPFYIVCDLPGNSVRLTNIALLPFTHSFSSV